MIPDHFYTFLSHLTCIDYFSEASTHDEDDDLVCAPLLHISNTTSGTEETVSPVLQQKGPRIKELTKVVKNKHCNYVS